MSFQIGDKVKIITSKCSCAGGDARGSIGEVTHVEECDCRSGSDFMYKVKITEPKKSIDSASDVYPGRYWRACDVCLRLVETSTASEHKDEAKIFRVGDKVRLISKDCCLVSIREVSVGMLGTVMRDSSSSIKVNFHARDSDWCFFVCDKNIELVESNVVNIDDLLSIREIKVRTDL